MRAKIQQRLACLLGVNLPDLAINKMKQYLSQNKLTTAVISLVYSYKYRDVGTRGTLLLIHKYLRCPPRNREIERKGERKKER